MLLFRADWITVIISFDLDLWHLIESMTFSFKRWWKHWLCLPNDRLITFRDWRDTFQLLIVILLCLPRKSCSQMFSQAVLAGTNFSIIKKLKLGGKKNQKKVPLESVHVLGDKCQSVAQWSWCCWLILAEPSQEWNLWFADLTQVFSGKWGLRCSAPHLLWRQVWALSKINITWDCKNISRRFQSQHSCVQGWNMMFSIRRCLISEW